MDTKFYGDRLDCTIEALKFALHVAGEAKHINVTDNVVVYSNGAGLFKATFETRNFMDDRREAMADDAKVAP